MTVILGSESQQWICLRISVGLQHILILKYLMWFMTILNVQLFLNELSVKGDSSHFLEQLLIIQPESTASDNYGKLYRVRYLGTECREDFIFFQYYRILWLLAFWYFPSDIVILILWPFWHTKCKWLLLIDAHTSTFSLITYLDSYLQRSVFVP